MRANAAASPAAAGDTRAAASGSGHLAGSGSSDRRSPPKSTRFLGGTRARKPSQLSATSSGTNSGDVSVALGDIHPEILTTVQHLFEGENIRYLQILVEDEGMPLAGRDENGNTCLHLVAAISAGTRGMEVLSFMLSHGMAPFLHECNTLRQSAVAVAAANHNWDCMCFLLGMGADVAQCTDLNSETPWDIAYPFPQGRDAVWQGLALQVENTQVLSNTDLSAAPSASSIAHVLAAVPPPPSSLSRRGFKRLDTLLSRTVAAGDEVTARYLVEYRGARPDLARAPDGRPLLALVAGDARRHHLLRFLCKRGADVCAADSQGVTPIVLATRARAWDNLALLVARGACISDRDSRSGRAVEEVVQDSPRGKLALETGLRTKHAGEPTSERDGANTTGSQMDDESKSSQHASLPLLSPARFTRHDRSNGSSSINTDPSVSEDSASNFWERGNTHYRSPQTQLRPQSANEVVMPRCCDGSFFFLLRLSTCCLLFVILPIGVILPLWLRTSLLSSSSIPDWAIPLGIGLLFAIGVLWLLYSVRFVFVGGLCCKPRVPRAAPTFSQAPVGRAEVRRVYVVINPMSGTRRGIRILETLVAPVWAKLGVEYTPLLSERPGHPAEMVRSVDFSGYDALCVVGGDGTLHEVVNGMASRTDGRRLPLGVIPGGSGNNVAFDIYGGCTDAHIKFAAEVIAQGHIFNMDIIRCTTGNKYCYCVTNVGIGMTALINGIADSPFWRKVLGPRRYDVIGLWKALSPSPMEIELHIDKEPPRSLSLLVLWVQQTQWFGLDMRLAPDAQLDDGKLDILLLPYTKDYTRSRMFQMFLQFKEGAHVENPVLSDVRQVRSITIEPHRSHGIIMCDGEVYFHEGPIRLKTERNALQILGTGSPHVEWDTSNLNGVERLDSSLQV